MISLHPRETTSLQYLVRSVELRYGCVCVCVTVAEKAAAQVRLEVRLCM